ncbi:hypothetical protein JCM21900_005204 [Sporobolomyces salmonicolor]
MADYSAYAPGLPPMSPPPGNEGSPAGPSSSSSYAHSAGALAPQLSHLQLDPSTHYHYPYQQHQQPSYPRQQRDPPSLPSLTIPPNQSSAGPSGPLSPGGSSYSAANRPRPSLGGGALGGAPTGPGAAGEGPGLPPAPRGFDYAPPVSPQGAAGAPRIPRKSSLPPVPAAGESFGRSTEPLPPLPTSSSTSHFPSASSLGGPAGMRDSSGGEAIFDGAALTSAVSNSFAPVHDNVMPAPPSTAAGSSNSARPSAAAAGKKLNPLEDLIVTETLYVEDLGVVIKRVAAAWSRSNFPPPALDTMFRAVEAVYRINKTLHGKLLEIGPNPSSPKALGDLLMRWISDLEPAYTRYASTLQLDFDSYAPVQSNPKLPPILASLSWPGTLPGPEGDEAATVTLDHLFQLPIYRIHYYKKLYAKLLRSTQEGRSDHALLVSANEKLARLEQLAAESRARSVLSPEEREEMQRRHGDLVRERDRQENEARERRQAERPRVGPPRLDLSLAQEAVAIGQGEQSSGESARIDSPSTSSSLRSSSATGTSTANTSAAAHSSPGKEPPLRVEELERRLNTERALDIFTMNPRKCKLQMQPPTLPFTRQLRKASSVTVSFIPTCDLSQRTVIHQRAYIILLTDLFLICEWMAPNEAGAVAGQDLWLLYPPLAGKHLRVAEGQARGEIEIGIMGKERLTIRMNGGEEEAREWKATIEEAIQFGAKHALSLRTDSGSSGRTRSPMSPTSPTSQYIGQVLSPTGSPLSPTFGMAPSGANVPSPLSRSPEPTSPTSSISRQEQLSQPFPSRSAPDGNAALGYGAPLNRPSLQSQQQQPYGERRAFSGPAQSVARPERNQSIAQGYSSQSLSSAHFGAGPSPWPSSPNFHLDNYASSSRGPSPFPGDFYGGSAQYQPRRQQQQQQAYPNGRQSPYSNQNYQPLEFAPPQAPFSNEGYGSRPSSRQSNTSMGSSSNRTDRSSGYPEPPPPLPKERSYNGLDISGRGGPIYPTSMRTDPGDQRSVSGRSDYLAPGNAVHRSRSADGLRGEPHYRMPSQALAEDRTGPAPGFGAKVGGRIAGEDDSPPPSPVDKTPDKTSIVAQMRCKIFLQQHHSVWKSLGTAKLKLYLSTPSNTKQLVVDSDKSNSKTLISTIVLTDGVERVGKTGVAIELSDQGERTGIVYMLQMKTEQAATGLFEQLLIGSDRVAAGKR